MYATHLPETWEMHTWGANFSMQGLSVRWYLRHEDTPRCPLSSFVCLFSFEPKLDVVDWIV
jgi:hypothetical protein